VEIVAQHGGTGLGVQGAHRGLGGELAQHGLDALGLVLLLEGDVLGQDGPGPEGVPDFLGAALDARQEHHGHHGQHAREHDKQQVEADRTGEMHSHGPLDWEWGRREHRQTGASCLP